MTWATIAIAAWCFTAAGLVGWLLLRLDRAATRSMDTHVDTALAVADARERHPATRKQEYYYTSPHPDIARFPICGSCGVVVYRGPISEHVCGGGRR